MIISHQLPIPSYIICAVLQILDSFVVSYVAFSLGKSLTGQTPATLPEVMSIAATGYGLKFFLAASLTPALYAIKSLMSEKFGLEAIPVALEENTNASTNDAVKKENTDI